MFKTEEKVFSFFLGNIVNNLFNTLNYIWWILESSNMKGSFSLFKLKRVVSKFENTGKILCLVMK